MNSPQIAPDPQLTQLVEKHLHHPWKRPIADHTRRAWKRVHSVLASEPERPVVLDSGCGTGESAWRLAERHPACWIIAVDQSAHRLNLQQSIRRAGTILWVRAELGDFWRLMENARIRLAAHYLLYPNPWPKKRHLRRRWHGHPAFPTLVRLGGLLEARSNWLVYLEELAIAIRTATGTSITPKRFVPMGEAITPFEKKYARSQHPLYCLRVCLPGEHSRNRLNGIQAPASTRG